MEAHQAASALREIGPEAEAAVLRLLKEKHLETKREACNILRQIGTRKSIDPLREAMLAPDQMLSQAATEAVRAIQSRAGLESSEPPRTRAR
jgi:HEAT repeat protein